MHRLERTAHAGLGIVPLAHVGDNQLPEQRSIQGRKQRARLVVVEMPPVTAHAAFERRRVGPRRQHGAVVVEFEYQALAAAEGLDHMRCHAAEVRKHTKGNAAGGEAVLAGLAGIVGHGDGTHGDVANVESVAGVEAILAGAAIEAAACKGTVGSEYRQTPGARQGGNAGRVIAVLVGNKNAVELRGPQAEPFEATARLPQREAAVDKQTRTGAGDDRAITPAAAAQRGNMQRRAGPAS